MYICNLFENPGNNKSIFVFFNSSFGNFLGEVWLGVHKESGFQVAIKTITVENKEAADDIRKEIDILKKCKNVSIVSYYGKEEKRQ